MGSSSNLAARLDFSLGRKFEDDVDHRFGTLVYHSPPSADGSFFFLLATFRRFLFQLTEDSVSWPFNLVWVDVPLVSTFNS